MSSLDTKAYRIRDAKGVSYYVKTKRKALRVAAKVAPCKVYGPCRNDARPLVASVK